MGLSRLIDPTAQIVIDASTVINVNATGCGARILKAIPNSVNMTDVVQEELLEDSRNGRNDGQMAAALVSAGLVAIARLDDLTSNHFEDLVIGSGDATLDDGEAATIAYGVEKGAVALIDERKATRLCAVRYPQLVIRNSLDILAHHEVLKELGEEGLAEAVFNAMQNARMRVPIPAIQWVVRLIGREKALLCESLPRAVRMQIENQT
jgi:predicted nucleic acid-binding protein